MRIWHCPEKFGTVGNLIVSRSTYAETSYRISYQMGPSQGAGLASGVKRTNNVQTLTHLCREVSGLVGSGRHKDEWFIKIYHYHCTVFL